MSAHKLEYGYPNEEAPPPSPELKGDKEEGHFDTEANSGASLGEKEDNVEIYQDPFWELTDAERRTLKLKCGLFMALVPGCSYALQYLDKSCVASASVMGLRQDLHMVGNQYSWTTSSYFIGYLVCNIPFALLLLEKLGPRWNGLALMGWGILVTCSAGAQSFGGFIACRVLLGMLESVCEPTITIMTHQWTPPDEHYAWIETWFAWNGFVAIFLNAIGYGLYRGTVHNEYTIAGWRILFIIIGLLSLLGATVYILVVPNSPQEAWFLNEKEKRAMKHREIGQRRKFHRSDIEWNQIVESLTTDLHKSFFLFLALFANALNGGAVNTFISLIIKNFVVINNHKLTNVQANERSLLYGMIPGAIKAGGCTLIVIACLNGILKKYRFAYVLFFAAVHVAAAFMLTYGAHDKSANHSGSANVALAGTYMYNFSVEVAHGGIISLIASNCQGRTKKIFVNGLTLLAFALGNILGPKVIFKADKLKQGWGSGRRAMAALSVVSLAALVFLLISYIIENRIKDKKNEKLPEGANPDDLTDRENPEFRYHY